MNLLFNYFEGFNEGIIGRESEMRDFMVKWGERPLEGGDGGRGGGVMWNFRELPMNDGAMETVENM